jgi:hypothetical protein
VRNAYQQLIDTRSDAPVLGRIVELIDERAWWLLDLAAGKASARTGALSEQPRRDRQGRHSASGCHRSSGEGAPASSAAREVEASAIGPTLALVMTRTGLDALIEEATVDAYNEHEQITGLFTRLDEHLAVPFDTKRSRLNCWRVWGCGVEIWLRDR